MVKKQTTTDTARSGVDDAALWRRFKGVEGEDIKIGLLGKLTPHRKAPDGFGVHLRNIVPPDDMRGEAILKGIWKIGRERVALKDGDPPWIYHLPSKHFADRLHRFGWLSDLMGQGGVGEETARYLIDAWIEQFDQFNGFAWRQGPLFDRIWNWLLCGRQVFDVGEDSVRQRRMESFARQLQILRMLADKSTSPQTRWRGAVSLVAAETCLLGGKSLAQSLTTLEDECTAQFLPDGGHVSRSPTTGLTCLTDLLILKDVLERADKEVPSFFDEWITRLAGMVCFFRAQDGALNSFNDGREGLAAQIGAVIDKSNITPRNFTFAPKSGFQKLEAAGLRLVLDCGTSPLRPFGDRAHAGALGFEFSDGHSRIITSCGYSAEVNVDWQAAVRGTGAHSTLILAGRDSARFSVNEDTKLRYPVGPEGMSAKRLEEADEIWLDAQHSGYKNDYGLLHRRRLFMAGNGRRLTGEDSLVRPISQGEAEDRKFINFEIRFHLHPTVSAIMSEDSIRLLCDSGDVWRFKTSHSGARLEESIYLSRNLVEKTEQIVLAGYADPNGDGSEPPNCIRWALIKETGE